MKTRRSSHRNQGYSLVEALVASALLGAMIGAAVSLMGTMNLQERTSYAGTVAFNVQEAAARLWQFGLTPTEALAVLPANTNNEFLDSSIVYSGTNAVTYGTAANVTLSSSMGTVENISCAITLKDPQGLNNRTNTVQVYRPVLR